VPAAPNPSSQHPWLRLNLVLRAMAPLAARDRTARPMLKAEFNKAIAVRAELKRHAWWN